MKLRSILAPSLAAFLALSAITFSAVSFAADPKPAAAKSDDVKGVRLIKPYSDLKDLTADQTLKLKEIHKKFSEQIKALEAQQKEEMSAVLTDEQKRELADTEGTKPRKTGGKKMKDDPATSKEPKAN